MPIDPVTGKRTARDGTQRGLSEGSAKARAKGSARKGDQRALKSGAFVSDNGVASLVTVNGTTFEETVKFAEEALKNAGTFQPAYLTACERYVRGFHRYRHLDDQADGLTAAQTKEKSRLFDQLTALEKELGLTPKSQAEGSFLIKAAQAAEAQARKERRPEEEMATRLAAIQCLVQIGAIPDCVYRDPAEPSVEVVNPVDPRERR